VLLKLLRICFDRVTRSRFPASESKASPGHDPTDVGGNFFWIGSMMPGQNDE
jgi:hypothetical protein